MEEFFQHKQILLENDQKDFNFLSPTDIELQASQKFNWLKNDFLANFTIEEMLDYWDVKDSVIHTKLFEVLKKMPKGALLHIHSSTMMHSQEFIDFLKSDSQIYVQLIDEKIILLPNFIENSVPLSEFLKIDGNEKALLDSLEMTRGTSMGLPSERWIKFGQLFSTSAKLFSEKRFRENYFNLAYSQLYEDNIQRVEIRTNFGRTGYIDNGRILTIDEAAESFKTATDRFRSIHNDFSSGFIIACHKLLSRQKVIEAAEDALRLHLLYPDFILGFDIVGEEEQYNETEEIYECVYQVKSKAKENGQDFPMFFHAGEVVSKHAPTIYDAFVLESKRIGHGISLIKHPVLMQIAKTKKITIECCPISNMLLGYVRDLRVHAGLAYLNQGLSVAIGSDAPGLFGYRGVTHDWLWICILWGIDLMQVKRLVKNSIDGCTEPDETRRIWEPKWAEFVNYLANLEI
ncbi:unnamed protein product [Blepharisma stoltei]|uniref:Adenosine deaminase domain-containing protein n=1 Tax=Blepharisma stoltei TaxID=1481888 RepID=A0AAU9IXL7_9CILI|nr:unnamed protein product [Blepharisma stoltei]